MICLIASSYINAKHWAASQHLNEDEWFFARDAFVIINQSKQGPFHTRLVPNGIEHVSNAYINTMLEYAWKYGRKK